MFAFLVFILFGYVVYLHFKINELGRRIGQGVPQANGLPEFPKPGQGAAHSKSTGYVPAVQPASFGQASGQLAAQSTDQASNNPTFQPQVHQAVPAQESALWRWISTDWPLKLGAFLVLLGLGWFVSYAFAQNWIGPMGRITLGLVFGAVLLVVGFLRAKKVEQQGTILMALGAAAILITTYAAREVYDFFTPLSALMLMASVSGFIAYSSVVDKVMSRSLVGLLVGCIAPFLTVSADPSVSGLFLYLFVLIAAQIWIVTITGWKELLVAAAAIYGLFSMISLSSRIPASETSLMIVLITAFVIMFYGVGVISSLKSKKIELADVFIKLISAGIFMLWVNGLVEDHWQSLVMVLASGLTALAAWGLLLQTTNRWLVVLHGALSLVYLAVAVAFELEGVVALLAYIALTTVGAYLAGMITQNYKTGQAFGLPFVWLFIAAIVQIGYRPVWSEILVVGVLAVVLTVLGTYWYSKLSENDGFEKPAANFITVYLYGALLTSVIFIWMSLEKLLLAKDTAHALALVIYTLAGVGMYGYGVINSHHKTKIAGGVLVGAVMARLFFVEIWNMVLAARVVVFTLIGGLLMAVAFLRPKKVSE